MNDQQLAKPLRGRLRVPSDKSISHRAVLFSGIAEGVSHVSNLLPSDDVLCSLAAIEALGAKVQVAPGPHGLSGTIEGIGGTWRPQPHSTAPLEIDCGNSGTTTRLLLGLLGGLGVHARLSGDASLSRRPMERVMKPLRAMGARFDSETGTLPLEVLPAGTLLATSYDSPVSSAQVKSAILLAGLSARGTTSVSEPAKSRDHTELMLPAYGVDVRVEGLRVSLDGPAKLRACDVAAPADPSSATFVAVAAALVPESDVAIEQVALNPTRTGAFTVMQRMGVQMCYENRQHVGAEPVGDVRVRYSPRLSATEVQADEIPALIDEIPVLALLAACAQGTTVFRSCGELRVKESDRFEAIRAYLAAFGVQTGEDGDDLYVVGNEQTLRRGEASVDVEPPAGAARRVELETHHDHRLAMTYHVVGLVTGAELALDDASCVTVSWPSFYEDMASLAAS